MAELSMADLFALETEVVKINIEGKKTGAQEKAPIIGSIYVKEFNSRDRRKLHELCGGDETRIPASYIIYGVCDKNGVRKFMETDEITLDELVTKITEMPDMVVAQMLAAVMKVNSKDEKATAKN